MKTVKVLVLGSAIDRSDLHALAHFSELDIYGFERFEFVHMLRVPQSPIEHVMCCWQHLKPQIDSDAFPATFDFVLIPYQLHVNKRILIPAMRTGFLHLCFDKSGSDSGQYICQLLEHEPNSRPDLLRRPRLPLQYLIPHPERQAERDASNGYNDY